MIEPQALVDRAKHNETELTRHSVIFCFKNIFSELTVLILRGLIAIPEYPDVYAGIYAGRFNFKRKSC